MFPAKSLIYVGVSVSLPSVSGSSCRLMAKRSPSGRTWMLMFFVKTDSHRTFEESQNVCPVQNVLIYNKQKQTMH